MIGRAFALIIGLTMTTSLQAQTPPATLVLEAKIPLSVSGRIDHLAVDLKRQHLFVAELGNDSLGVVDLAAGKLLRTIPGLASRRASDMNGPPIRSMWRMPATAPFGCFAARI